MAGLSVHHPLPFIFGILGNIISFMVYLAPIPTFWRIYKKKSTQGFQSVPYFVALFSASLWIYYALVKTDALLLITINSFGCVIEFIYLAIYLIYATRSARIFTIQMITLMNVVAFGLIVVLTQLLAHGTNRVVILGWICVGFSVCVFAAPLSIIRLVIRTKSVEFMPFWLSFFLTLSAIAWFAYGLFTRDLYVQLPNVLGFSFGVIQMVLYIIYMKKATVVEPTSPDQKVVIVDHAINPSLVLDVPNGGIAVYDEESGFDKKKAKESANDQGVELNPPV